MHCPNCGQQQVSNEIRFCSRCGFPLGLVAEVLAHGGFLPQLADLNKKKQFTKKHGVFLSLFWFVLFALILTPFFGMADADEVAGVMAILGVFGSFLMLVGSLIFLKSEKSLASMQFQNTPQQFLNQFPNVQPQNLYQTSQNVLPPSQSQPVSSFVPPSAGSWKAADTGELVQPRSVVEDTTKLLNKEKF